jgi:23S rRNA (guanosine2251-2'-O)-methyltransferase
VERVPRERLQALAESGAHQGVAARLREFAYATLEECSPGEASGRPRWWWCWTACQDPHNLGRGDPLRRTRWGPTGWCLPKDRSVGVTAAVARASAGAVEHVPVARVTNLPGPSRS